MTSSNASNVPGCEPPRSWLRNLHFSGASPATTGSVRSTAYRLGPADQVPLGEGRVFEVAGTRVAVFRPRAGGVYATQPACPHRGGPLADGTIGGTTLVCPLHLRAFDLASGRQADDEQVCLTTYPVEVTPVGDLLLHLSPGEAGGR